MTFPLDGYTRIGRFSDGRMPPNLWYFLHDGARDGRGYFVGYDSQSKLCVGFIGRDGFRPDQPPVEQWFPMDGAKLASGTALPPNAYNRYNMPHAAAYSNDEPEFPQWNVDMISGAQLLEVDLRTGSVKTLLESADLIAAGMLYTAPTWEVAGKEAPRIHRHPKLAVRTTDRVLLFDATGKQHAAFLIPEEFRDRSIGLYELDAGRALLTASRLLPDRSSCAELLWIDPSGTVSRRAEVCLGEGDRYSDETDPWKTALVFPAPVALAFLATVTDPWDYLKIGLEPTYSAALARSLAASWPPMLVVSLLAAALAWHCFRRHRRFYQPASGLWFAFVVLAGVPGLVAYLFHRRWPPLEKCPACGQDVPRDRETCANCGVTFPAPEPKGCEVFA